MTFIDLPIDSITRNPDQPRKLFDPEALSELAGSIKANGLLEPVVVRPHPEDPENTYLLIAGERRWRACREAGVTTVPARILEVDEATAFELSVAENVNRHDMTPIEEARAYATLGDYGRDVAAVAKLFGKTERYVHARLLLLDLSAECQAQVEAGRITVSVAQQIAQCNAGNQQAMLFRLMRGDFRNDNEALHAAFAMKEGEKQMGLFEVEEPTEEEREERRAVQRRARSLLQRAESLAGVLEDLANLSIADYVALGDPIKTEARLDRLAQLIGKARFNARQGAAVIGGREAVAEMNASMVRHATEPAPAAS